MKKIALSLFLLLFAGTGYGQQNNYNFEFKAGPQHTGNFQVGGLAGKKDRVGFVLEQDNQRYSIIDGQVFLASPPTGYQAILKATHYPLHSDSDGEYFNKMTAKPVVIYLDTVTFKVAILNSFNIALTCHNDSCEELDIELNNFNQPFHPFELDTVHIGNLQIGKSKIQRTNRVR